MIQLSLALCDITFRGTKNFGVGLANFDLRDIFRDYNTNKHAFSFEPSLQVILRIKVDLGAELSSELS
jgi:hypothetical protein